MTAHKLRVSAVGQKHIKVLPFTWAQANMWESILAFGDQAHRLNLRLPLALPRPYPDTERVLADISGFIATAEIARTVFDPTVGAQAVKPALDVSIQVAEDGGNTEEASTELLAEMARSAFRLREEPPIRFGLVVSGDEVRALTLVLSHLAFDGASVRLVRRLVEKQLSGVAEEIRQPESLVRYETSDRMRERSDATLRHWAKSLSALPAGRGLRFTAPGDFTTWELRSRVFAIAAQRIAVRASVTATTVVLAALTSVLGAVLADPPQAMLLVCGNRQHADLADYPGIALGNALYVIPRSDSLSGFDAHLASAHMSAIRGYSRARYDSVRWREMLAETNAKGTTPDLSFYFNDARTDFGAWDGLEHQVGELKAWKRSSQSVGVLGHSDLNDATLFFNLRGDGPDARATMVCDNAVIPPGRAVEILQGLEEFLIEQALR